MKKFYVLLVLSDGDPGIILSMRPANKRRRYNVTSSLIGWSHSQSVIGSCLHTGPVTRAFMFSLMQVQETLEQTLELSVIWDGMILMWHHCNEDIFPSVSGSLWLAACVTQAVEDCAALRLPIAHILNGESAPSLDYVTSNPSHWSDILNELTPSRLNITLPLSFKPPAAIGN